MCALAGVPSAEFEALIARSEDRKFFRFIYAIELILSRQKKEKFIFCLEV